MKRFVVEVEVLGRRQTRLVPAKDKNTACRNCTTAESKVISCVPYTGQKLNLSNQEELAQGCINISGTYPYETYEYMGLCVRMDAAIEVGEWSPGMYRLYYEDEEAYWNVKNETSEGVTDNE